MRKRLITLILMAFVSATSHAAGGSRTSCNYTALERDLEQVRQGIRDYLDRARREPRELPP